MIYTITVMREYESCDPMRLHENSFRLKSKRKKVELYQTKHTTHTLTYTKTDTRQFKLTHQPYLPPTPPPSTSNSQLHFFVMQTSLNPPPLPNHHVNCRLKGGNL